MFSSPTEVLGQSRLRYLLHQGHTGGAREGTHVAIVTRKVVILGNQGQALSSTDEEGAEFQRLRIIVQSGDEVSQRVMTKKCFG